MEQRRNDVGYKIMIGVVIACSMLFINYLISIASQGKDIGFANTIRITTLESSFNSITNDLNEIKILLRRQVPNDQHRGS